jgi:hypothetical protein
MKIILSLRRHHYVARASIFLIMVALIVGMVGCSLPSQNLKIRDWYDLYAIRNNLDGHHILMNDLDSTTAGYEELASPTANEGRGWEPIVIFVFDSGYIGLDGTFDGQGHEIRDLFINRGDYVGLFGSVEYGGVIKDIGLVNVTVTGASMVGGLVGENGGTISNSYFTGSVTGASMVGGLVGQNAGTVSNSYSTSSVTGNEPVGGLVGWNTGNVSNSYSTGGVTGSEDVGGLVGQNWGTVSNSYYSYDEVLINGENIVTIGALPDEDFDQWLANDKFLDVNERLSQENGYYLINNGSDFKQLLAFGQDATLKFRLTNDLDLGVEPNFYIPYLAGEFDGNGHKISNLSFNLDFVYGVGLFGYLAPGGKVSQVGVENVNITGLHFVGTLVGWNYGGTVSNSYSTGSVTGNFCVGGLVGMSWPGTVTNSYSTASVSGNNVVGGLVGYNKGTVSAVSNSYSTGRVTGEDSVGGLVGTNGGGTVSNSFWDTENSGQSTSAGGTGKTTAEMQDIATFSDAGWDIIAVANPSTRNPSYFWNIVDDETYPFLSWHS